MKILIVKNNAALVDLSKANTYNNQEIGFAQAANRMGIQCDIVFWGKDEPRCIEYQYDEDGHTFKIFFLKAFKILNMLVYRGLLDLTEKYDIVHSLEYQMIQSWILAKYIPNKLIVYNGAYYSDFNKRFNKWCKFVDFFFLPTYKKNKICFDTKSSLSEKFLRAKGLENVSTIGVGLNLDVIDSVAVSDFPLVNKLQALKENGYRLLLYIGRIEPRRNIKFLLSLAQGLSKREKIKLVVIGSRGPEDYKKEIFKYIETNKMDDFLVYEPFLDQKFLKAVYRLCEVFLLPTYYEIFGMVLLEAMYYGIPVVSTLNGGSDLLIEDQKSGFIVKNNDYDAWEETVLNVLNDPELAKKIGRNAHAVISESYTWDALVTKFLSVAQFLLEGRKGLVLRYENKSK